ncbi:hypothetical protein ACWFPY_23855 [Nocardia fluminea]
MRAASSSALATVISAWCSTTQAPAPGVEPHRPAPTTAALEAAVDGGELSLDIAQILPITELAIAHRRIEPGWVRGKIVLTADR